MYVYVVSHVNVDGGREIDGVFSSSGNVDVVRKPGADSPLHVESFVLDGAGELSPADAFRAGHAEGLAAAQDERESEELASQIGQP